MSNSSNRISRTHPDWAAVANSYSASGRSLREIGEEAIGRAPKPKNATTGLESGKKTGRNKYGAKKVVTEDGVFDSQIEHRRWCELEQMERAGLICELCRQIPFELVVNSVRIGKFTIDHQWVDVATSATVYEDVKGGPISRDFPLRKKLLLALYGISLQIWPERKRKARKGK